MSDDDVVASEEAATKPAAPKQRRPRKKRRETPKKASRKAASTAKKSGFAARRPFPGVTLEDALRIPRAIKDFNGGNPWPPAEVANALNGMSSRTDKFWYLSSGARDYGMTVGTRDSETIALAPLGRDLVYATSPEVEARSLRPRSSTSPFSRPFMNITRGEASRIYSIFKTPLRASFMSLPSTTISL